MAQEMGFGDEGLDASRLGFRVHQAYFRLQVSDSRSKHTLWQGRQRISLAVGITGGIGGADVPQRGGPG